MLAPRHFAAMREQMAIDAALARLELEALIEAAPAIYAAMGARRFPCPHLWSCPNLNPLHRLHLCR